MHLASRPSLSDFTEEVESETGSDSGDISSHDGSKSDTDSDYVGEPSTSAGSRRGKKSTNKKRKGKECSGGKQGRSARVAKSKSANSSNAPKQKKPESKITAWKEKTKGAHSPGTNWMISVKKLEGKRPMCWKFVSERLAKQYIMKHYKTHRQLIEEILDDRYNELRDLVHHMFSFYVQLVSEIAKAV